jgi:hypothetical protein
MPVTELIISKSRHHVCLPMNEIAKPLWIMVSIKTDLLVANLITQRLSCNTKQLSSLETEISITTNGILIDRHLAVLKSVKF